MKNEKTKTQIQAVLVSGAGLIASTAMPWIIETLLFISLFSIILVHITLERIKELGRNKAAIIWTSIPAIEAALVAQIADQNDLVITSVAIIFGLWSAAGCYIIFKKQGASDSLPQDREHKERTIKWGTEF